MINIFNWGLWSNVLFWYILKSFKWYKEYPFTFFSWVNILFLLPFIKSWTCLHLFLSQGHKPMSKVIKLTSLKKLWIFSSLVWGSIRTTHRFQAFWQGSFHHFWFKAFILKGHKLMSWLWFYSTLITSVKARIIVAHVC
jgi:hypothetical protein